MILMHITELFTIGIQKIEHQRSAVGGRGGLVFRLVQRECALRKWSRPSYVVICEMKCVTVLYRDVNNV